jgi:hypothetical protein
MQGFVERAESRMRGESYLEVFSAASPMCGESRVYPSPMCVPTHACTWQVPSVCLHAGHSTENHLYRTRR